MRSHEFHQQFFMEPNPNRPFSKLRSSYKIPRFRGLGVRGLWVDLGRVGSAVPRPSCAWLKHGRCGGRLSLYSLVVAGVGGAVGSKSQLLLAVRCCWLFVVGCWWVSGVPEFQLLPRLHDPATIIPTHSHRFCRFASFQPTIDRPLTDSMIRWHRYGPRSWWCQVRFAKTIFQKRNKNTQDPTKHCYLP